MTSSTVYMRNVSTYGFYATLLLGSIGLLHGYCPRGWITHGRKCYGAFMPDFRSSSVEVKNSIYCAPLGGRLINTKTEEENNIASKLLRSRSPLYNTRAIIGLIGRVRDASFRWGDGTSVSNTWSNWQNGQPDHKRGQDCVVMFDDGEWNDVSCDIENDQTVITLCQQDIEVSDSCPSGWKKHDGKCYKGFPPPYQPLTVHQLEKMHCIANNGHLMDTKTKEQHEIAFHLMYSVSESYHGRAIIGLNDRSSEGSYRWGDGSFLTHTWQNWFEGQPDNYFSEGWFSNGEDCVELRGDGKWNDIRCTHDNLIGYITLCEKPIEGDKCPTGWTEYGLMCYAGFPPQKGPDNVADMEDKYCKANGGKLMNPKTEDENNLGVNLLKFVLANGTYPGCIGLNDRVTEGNYKWSDGTFLKDGWTMWAEGAPDNTFFFPSGDEDCVLMVDNGVWNDHRCDIPDNYGYITLCEKPIKDHMNLPTPPQKAPTSSTQKTTVKDEVSHPTHAPKNAEVFQRSRVFNKATTFGENPYIVSECGTNRTTFSMTACFSKCMQIQDCTALNFSAKRSQCRLFTSVTAEHVQEVENVPDWILYMSTDVSGSGPR